MDEETGVTSHAIFSPTRAAGWLSRDVFAGLVATPEAGHLLLQLSRLRLLCIRTFVVVDRSVDVTLYYVKGMGEVALVVPKLLRGHDADGHAVGGK